VKRVLGYLAGIGLGAAAATAVARRMGPPRLGDKPRRPRPAPEAGTKARGRLGATVRRALDEGRRVMRQTEAELAEQVTKSDGGP
jgi:hypothetical protein